MRHEIDIFHYFNIYKKNWKKMVFLVVLAMFITVLIIHFQPLTYRSTVVALSAEKGGQVGAVGKFLGLSTGGSSNDIIFSILKSRRMKKDINEYFNLKDKRKFWWGLDAYIVTGGFAIEVKGPDPLMTEKIANFAVKNVDKINKELDITTEKYIIKVLDPAIKGVATKSNISKRIISSGLFVFLIYTLFIFFKEYFSYLRGVKK